MKNTKILFVWCIILLCVYSEPQKPIGMNYHFGPGIEPIRRYIQNIQNGYFVDIGCNDPVFGSTTIFLRRLGWDGVNVDANPNNTRKFNLLRPQQVNLNYVVG